MHLVVAVLVSKPDKNEELAGLLRELAAASRGDAGCLSYTFARDLDDPNVFRSFETWESKEAAEAHMQTPHIAAALAAAPSLVAAELEITEYAVSS